MSTLFDSVLGPRPPFDLLGPGTAILNGFALKYESDMAPLIQAISKLSPFRHMITPGGFRMSVALTNCGRYGWVSDRGGIGTTPSIQRQDNAGRGCPRIFGTWLELPHRQRAFRRSIPMRVLLIVTRRGRGSRFIRTRTNEISHRRLFQSRSDCRPRSSLEAWNVPIRPSGFQCIMATFLCGEVQPDYVTTE